MPPANTALLRAIAANPDEDTPRLAYADWLDENGEPAYAAFIRAQVALAGVPEYDPRWVRAWFDDRDAITGRGFDAFLPALPDGVAWVPRPFRRGFPAAIRVTTPAAFAAHAADVFVLAPVQSLEVRSDHSAPPPDLTPLTESPWLAKVRALTFTFSRLPAAEVDRLRQSPHAANLTALDFQSEGLDAAAVAAVCRAPLLPRLTRLHFRGNNLPWPGLAPVIQKAGGPHRLRSLEISENTPRRFDTRTVFAAPLLRGLTELDLSCADLGPEGVRALCESPVIKTLESLTLRRSPPGANGGKALAGCAALAGLRRLVMVQCAVGVTAAQNLVRSPHLANLRVLDLSSNPIGDKGAKALADSPHLTNLVHLELMHCEIGDAGAEALLNSPNTANLTHLCVYGDSRTAKIGDRVKRLLKDRFGGRVFV